MQTPFSLLPKSDLWEKLPAGHRDNKKIIMSARTLFHRQGISKTTFEQIAEHADISRATLYRRFKDKDSLIMAYLLDEAEITLKQIEQRLQSMESPVEALIEAFIQACLAGYQHPLYKISMQKELEQTLPVLTQQVGPAFQLTSSYLALQISEAQKQGYFSQRPANTSAELILRLLQSLLLSPEGIISPKSEASLRLFSEDFLRPLFE